MNPRWTVYGAVVDDRRDEELLNDCFADLIDDSLARGPGLLNFLFDGVVEFDDSAELIATDGDPLPYRGGDIDRKIDFTIADDELIAGFESKRRDNLSINQLSDEIDKLKHNANGRDVLLVAITEHWSEPAMVTQFPNDAAWSSWFAISQRAFDADDLGSEWQPTISRAQKMFREFGYNEYTGIDEDEFQVTVWELWKQIATQSEDLKMGMRWPHKMLKEVAGTSKGYRPIDPDWMMLTYGKESSKPREACYVLLSNKKTGELWIGLAIRPFGNEDLRRFLCDSAEDIANQVIEADLEVIQFPLDWLVGRKNLPSDHRKAVSESRPSSKEELIDALSDDHGMKHDGANRFVFGFSISPDNPLDESLEYLDRLRDLFGAGYGPELEQILD